MSEVSKTGEPRGDATLPPSPTGDELVAQTETAAAHGAARNLFDLRYVIAALLAIYGVILTVYGTVMGSPQQLEKSGGVPINLWAGIGMLVVAAGFTVWGTLKPVRMEPGAASSEEGRPAAGDRPDVAG